MFWRRRGTARSQYQDPNALPEHATPDQVRASYATETTRVGSSVTGPYGGSGGHGKYLTPSSDQLEMNTYGPATHSAGRLPPPGTPTSSKYGNTNPYTGRPAPRDHWDGVYDV